MIIKSPILVSIFFQRKNFGVAKMIVTSSLIDPNIDQLLFLLRPEVLLQTLSNTFGEKMSEFSEWLVGETPNPTHKFLARALKNGHMVNSLTFEVISMSSIFNVFFQNL